MLAVVVVLALAVTATVLVRPGPVDGWLGGAESSAPGLASDPAPAPVLAALSSDAPVPTADGVAREIDSLVSDSVLGSQVNIAVHDLATGESLYSRGADSPAVPASTMKLVTAVSVLSTRGPTYRIPTRAVLGKRSGEVVLIGGGDPTLAINGTASYSGAARLDKLAEQVKAALGDVRPTRVTVDSTLFSGPVYGPWDAGIATGGWGGPTTALMTDGARVDPKDTESPSTRYTDADLAAGQAFAKLLGLSKSDVSRGEAPAGTTPADQATVPPTAGGSGTPVADAGPGTELGRVESMPIVRMVEYMLSTSDNVVAEMLARQVALDQGETASYAGAARAVHAVLTDLGMPMDQVELADGSGFSRQDQLTPNLLTGLLQLAADSAHPELNGLFSGLPVAGWSGTLGGRYRSPQASSQAGAGLVRAKTGTLAGVNSLAGIVIDADGRALAFAVMANDVPVGQEAAQDALDRIAAALAGCGCR